MTGRRISVVVPFHNNVDLLGECLASIAAQTHGDLEVIMVDDGSTDDAPRIARAQAQADPRFRLITIANSGPGAARNAGIAAATGDYLAFVDSDDVLPPDAYATLLAALERSGSDFVSGGVLRLSSAGLGRSGLHDRAVKVTRSGTHISRAPELFYDVSVWNKLFRRSFWDSAGLALPEGMVWEDLVAMTRAHVLAGAVDVITEPVYHWRDRDKGAPSITQSRAQIANLRDRITAFTMIDDFLRGSGSRSMLRQHQRKALVNDLWLYVRDLPAAGADYRREFTELAATYLSQVDRDVLADLPSEHKLACYLISRRLDAELAEFAAWLADHPGRTPPMIRVRGRLRADLPLRQDRRLDIPDEVFRPPWRELDPQMRVDAISGQRGALVIEGAAYVPSMDIGKRRSTGKFLVLVPRGHRRPPLVLPVRSVRRPDVTAASGQDRYSYDWSGFRCQLSGRLLRLLAPWLASATWDCLMLVRGRAVWRPVRLHSPGPAAQAPQEQQIAPGLTIVPRWAGGRLTLSLRRGQPSEPPPQATGLPSEPPPRVAGPMASARQSWAAGTLMVAGTIQSAGAPGGWRVLLRHADGAVYDVPVVTEADSFSVAVPVGKLDTWGEPLPLRDGRWEVTIRDAAGRPVAGTMTTQSRPAVVGRKVYRARPAERDGCRLVLEVGPSLRLAERGRIRRRLMRDVYYRAQRLLPVRDVIFLASFQGRQCGDNPRAIADEFRRRGDVRPQVWAVDDWSVPVPAGASAVLTGTMAYFAALARSRYLIVNNHVPLPYRKRSGQSHVQTWHGTPLKRLGYDIGEPKSAAGRRYLDYLAVDVSQWDLLLSPNPFSTPIMRRAFGYSGEIAETGYPRNDALIAPAVGAADRVRQRLGLPDGKRVAMYVPTWRDDQHDAAGRYLLDLQLELEAAARRLGDEYVLLVRGHHLMAGSLTAGEAPGFVIDVTSYPDIGDLLLVTDVLITDYSSVMFDFAPTGRPMIFFTYDLEHYRDRLRGFYFDFEADAPGPRLETSVQVVDALADIDAVAARYETARAAFAARFCPLDDGKASARACDRIFGG
ncbi:MAG TPA: bifunctional glycosyltransferase family 2 protein/CDP-glycerol:glycerophosphate glycerophosphotransferase [Streptosporangiaceae bacterium]